VNTHHSYVKKYLPEIRGYAAKVAKVHGGAHPELATIQTLVETLNAELLGHLHKEEAILFPFIKRLVKVEPGQNAFSPFGTIQNPISVMELEHETAGGILEKIRALTNNYTLPADACASYSLLYRMLDEFENDLHTHVHLENNILFPKALALEKN
jgi:regulator of cell morphogenesis and NO signaling